MERLLLARHGESAYSARGLANGDPAVAVGLTARGEDEAQALGRALAAEPLDLCVVSALPRTRATAELALAGRDVPLEVWPELNDPRVGEFENRPLADYRAWAWSVDSMERAPGGGESRREIVARYARGWRTLLERPEQAVLAVAHALPIAYLLLAREGTPPPPQVTPVVAYAEPYRFEEAELDAAVAVLEAWLAEPTW